MAITTQDIIKTLDADMTAANEALLENSPDRFNRYVLNLLQAEIKTGKEIAQRKRNKDPESRLYVHYSKFPLAVYEGLTPEFLKELELLDIFIYRKENLNTAGIRIVFRF